MSHLTQRLEECRQTPGCDPRAVTGDAGGSTPVGDALGVVALVTLVAGGGLLAAAFVRRARRLAPAQRRILYRRTALWAGIPAVLVLLPLIGFVTGFAVGFTACFKSPCSGFEETAHVTLSLAGLVLAVPVAVVLGRRLRRLPRLD